MERLNAIISDYLQVKNTDYALMINGKWGCGKTYYLEHDFKDFIEQQEYPFASYNSNSIKERLKRIWKRPPNKHKFNIAFISLYGVSSPEDFYYRVFLGVNSWAKTKIFALIGSAGIKLANVFNLKISKEDASKINFISNNTILVFDDLERIYSDKISVKEILGLLTNTLNTIIIRLSLLVTKKSIRTMRSIGNTKRKQLDILSTLLQMWRVYLIRL